MEKHAPTPRNAAAMQAIVLLTSFVAMLNETSINVALPNLMEVFGVSVSTVQWLVTGFMLVMAVVVPVTAFIIQSFPVRKIYFTSLGLLLTGGILAGFAPSFGFLLAGRLIQAAGTCCLMSLTVNVVLLLSSDKDKGKAMGLIGLVTLFAPAVAPSLAGLVLQILGWQWMFLGMLPLFVLLGGFALATVENIIPTSRRSLDIPSVILVALGFGGLLYGITGLNELHGVMAWVYPGALIVGLVAVTVLVLRQLRMAEPLIDVRVFKFPMFSLAMVAVFFCILTVFGITVLMPMLLVQALGMSAAVAGLCMLPGGVLNGLSAPIFGKLFDKAGPRKLIIPGMIALVAAVLIFAFIPADLPLGAYIAVHILALLAISLVMTVSQANGMSHVPRHLNPHGTAIMSTLMQLGGGFGSALYVAVLSMTSLKTAASPGEAFFPGFHAAFLVGAMALVIPLVCAFFVRGKSHDQPSSLG